MGLSTDSKELSAGLSTRAKGCIACGVGTAIVLAVMIPVTILVIAPKMGQHALEVSVMNIPNSTVYDIPDNLHLDHTANIVNSVSLTQTALPFSAKMHETQMVMTIPAFEADPSRFIPWSWNETNIAWFTMPEITVKHGTNNFEISTTIDVLENTDIFTRWAFLLACGGFPGGATVWVAGQPKLTTFGIFSMSLKMGKKMNCSYVPPEDGDALVQNSALFQTFEESITARRLSAVRGMAPVTMTCMDAGEMDSDHLDTVLDSFTQQLERTTTTTAAPTTTAPAVV